MLHQLWSSQNQGGPGFCKGGETWGVKSAIFKLGGPKSQVCETWEPKMRFSLIFNCPREFKLVGRDIAQFMQGSVRTPDTLFLHI